VLTSVVIISIPALIAACGMNLALPSEQQSGFCCDRSVICICHAWIVLQENELAIN
jgi:hypothetical protein